MITLIPITEEALPVSVGVVKVLFVVSWFQMITLNHTNDSDASPVSCLIGAHTPKLKSKN